MARLSMVALGGFAFVAVVATAAVAMPLSCAPLGAPTDTLTIVNEGGNAVRVETCAYDYNKVSCSGSPGSPLAYHRCPRWLMPHSTVELSVPKNVTYLALVYCVDKPKRSIHCLSSPQAPEVYKKPALSGTWPAEPTHIPYPGADTEFCDKDLDCDTGKTCKRASGATYTCQ